MRPSLITLCFLIGLSMAKSTAEKSENETKVQTLENVDFGEMKSDKESGDVQRKRDSGYNYNKPIRYNRPNFRSKNRGRFSKNPNQLNRPFNLYGPPIHDETLNLQRPNQHQEQNQNSAHLYQGAPNPTKNYEFETDPVPDQNDLPFRIDTANYLPPKNQKLPANSAPNAFSAIQGHGQEQGQKYNQHQHNQNAIQTHLHDQRISDAALFLTQNAKLLSQLYGAPASNQEYAPNNEYLEQLANHHQNMGNHLNSQVENTAGSQGFPRPLPSYASGIINPRETLENIQSLEKDRIISQLRLALDNQAQFQDSIPLGRNAPVLANVHQVSGNEAGNLENPVSSSVFGDQHFGHASFLSGSAISPSVFKVTYGLPASSQVPAASAVPSILPQGPTVDASSSGASGSTVPFGQGAIGTESVRPGSLGTSLTRPESFGAGSIRPESFGTGSAIPGSIGIGSIRPGSFGTGTALPGTFGTGAAPGSFSTGSIKPGSFGTGSTSSESFGTGSASPGSFGTGSLKPGSAVPGSGESGSSKPSLLPNFPQYGAYIPTLIPGTNFVANIPASSFLGSSLFPFSNNPSSSSPTHFAIPIPVNPDQKPISGNPGLIIPPSSFGKPGVQFSGPGHTFSNPLYPINNPVHPQATPVHPIRPTSVPVANPSHPVAIPVQPANPFANPSHPIATPVQPVHPIATPVQPVHPIITSGQTVHPIATPVQPIRPVTAPSFQEVAPVHPTYGVQSNFLNSLFIKPLKPVFPIYYYPNIQLQIPKPSSANHPWNYAPTFQQNKPNWK